MYDVIIIGAGVSGSAIARELSKYELSVAVLEKASDVCEGTSKANSGIVHGGYDAMPGTLKAKLNVRGNQMMEELSRNLDFPFQRNGSLVLCFDDKDRDHLKELLLRGEENGVEGLQILEREELLAMEPQLGDEVKAALFVPTGGIVCPFGLTIALAENAADNGVSFFLNTEVTAITKKENGYDIHTTKGEYETQVVINAAGVYADTIHNMISNHKIKIQPRRGEYLLFDKNIGTIASHTLFQLPTALGKGILVTPTVHGNLLTGPTAEDLIDKEETATTADGMAAVKTKASLSVRDIPFRQVITSFAGLRARLVERTPVMNFETAPVAKDDFLIGELPDAPGFLDVAGMESPGLSCAPATGEYVAELVKKLLPLKEKKQFKATRKGIPFMAELSQEERQQMIHDNAAFANVICRCEMVTEGEILEAIHRTLGATTTDGVKRRTRAGMGRCQSGFCNPRVVEILAQELHMDESEICKAEPASYYVLPNKEEQV